MMTSSESTSTVEPHRCTRWASVALMLGALALIGMAHQFTQEGHQNLESMLTEKGKAKCAKNNRHCELQGTGDKKCCDGLFCNASRNKCRWKCSKYKWQCDARDCCSGLVCVPHAKWYTNENGEKEKRSLGKWCLKPGSEATQTSGATKTNQKCSKYHQDCDPQGGRKCCSRLTCKPYQDGKTKILKHQCDWKCSKNKWACGERVRPCCGDLSCVPHFKEVTYENGTKETRSLGSRCKKSSPAIDRA